MAVEQPRGIKRKRKQHLRFDDDAVPTQASRHSPSATDDTASPVTPSLAGKHGAASETVASPTHHHALPAGQHHRSNGSTRRPTSHTRVNAHGTTQPTQPHRNGTSAPARPTAALIAKTKDLPIHSHRQSIISALNASPVLVLTGETGSGKSTQLPQFLLPSLKPSQRIAVTQPRRVAAISLARRVAAELACPLGRAGKAARVGYSMRFDRNVGHGNQLVYLTEGMLLMEMLSDPGLCGYGVVVLDEVHERGVDVDLLLGFLRDLVAEKGNGAAARKAKGVDRLKVVVMSATADVEALRDFFDQGLTAANVGATEQVSHKSSVVKVEGRQYPVQVTYLPQPSNDFTEDALKCIFRVHCREPMPGDVLVFMTGQETIQGLQRNVEEYAQSLGPEYPKLLVLPIYAALSQAAQQRVFDPAPPNTRKIILATNIAETSITVPGVRFVIDSGKEKRKQFRPRLNLESLLVKSISQSSAIQRKGRAGREAPGKCWRLYTEAGYDSLEENKAPEIMRCDLADAVLKMKANGVEDVVGFPFLTSPPKDALARSLLHLYQLDALGEAGALTPLGRQLSRFPLAPSYARVILAAAASSSDGPSVLLPVIDIIACFTADTTIFLAVETETEREEAATARASLIRRQGDHITLLATVQGYSAENTDRKAWAKRYMVSHRAMQAVMDVRKQLRQLCVAQKLTGPEEIKLYDEEDGGGKSAADETAADRILRCFLAGFKQNVARLVPDGSYRTLIGNQTVAVHPSSVLFGRKVEALVYSEFVYTTRSYARGCGVVQGDWLQELYV